MACQINMMDNKESSLGKLLLGFFIFYGYPSVTSREILSQVMPYSSETLCYKQKAHDDVECSLIDDDAINGLGIGGHLAIEDRSEEVMDLGRVIAKVQWQVRIFHEFGRAIKLFQDYNCGFETKMDECERDKECKLETTFFHQLFEIYEERDDTSKQPQRSCSSMQVISDTDSDISSGGSVEIQDEAQAFPLNWEQHTDGVLTGGLQTSQPRVESCGSNINQFIFIDTVLSWGISNIKDSNLFTKDIRRIPSEFRNYQEWYGCFSPFVFEEMRHQLSLAMDKIDEMHRYKFAIRNRSSPSFAKGLSGTSSATATATMSIEVDRRGLTSCDFENLDNSVSSFALIVRSRSKSKSIKWQDFVRDQEHTLVHINGRVDIKDEDEVSTIYTIQICSNFSKLLSLNDNSEQWDLILLSVGSTTSARICDALGRRDRPSFMHDVLTGRVQWKDCDEVHIGADVAYDHFTKDLNDSQREAIDQVMNVGKIGVAPIQIIKGPPGKRGGGCLYVLVYLSINMSICIYICHMCVFVVYEYVQ